MNPVERMVAPHLRQFATMRAIARAAGMTESGFLRGLKLGRVRPENCLRLAHALGASPTAILRASGHRDLAALLEAFYGRTGRGLSARARAVLDGWHRLDREAQNAVTHLITKATR